MIALTNVGLKRLTNQDYVRILTNSCGDSIAVLCDGLGGHNSGEIASEIVVEHFINEFKKMKFSKTIEDYVTWIKEHISISNDKVFELSKSNENYSGMGTTIVLCVITKEEFIIANVGDSRAYIVEQDYIRQVSDDHTFVNLMVKMGKLSLLEAETHPERNVVMQALGIEQELYPHIVSMKKDNISSIILMCDGLNDYVSNKFIEQVLIDKKHSNEIKGKILIEKALEAGGKDNISLAILDIKE